MSLQYVEPTANVFPVGIFAKTGTGGNQQGAGKPSKKKAAKKAAKKKKK
jgi:hypothetical protein